MREKEDKFMQMSVQVNNLVKRFGSFPAVDDISFSVAKGEIFGFIGPNGAGKSTTIRMLCGILDQTSGVGTVEGFSIKTEPEKIKSVIGYMSQKFSLYDDLTVEENINFYGGIHGLSRDETKTRRSWILEMAGLRGKESNMTGALSGGWRQRLSLGCAIIHGPKVVFLDEPTAGVDPISRREFWLLIRGLAKAGTTIFVTTHYMDEVEFCDRIAMIYRGKIVAMGTSAELKTANKVDNLEMLFVNLIRGME